MTASVAERRVGGREEGREGEKGIGVGRGEGMGFEGGGRVGMACDDEDDDVEHADDDGADLGPTAGTGTERTDDDDDNFIGHLPRKRPRTR